MTAFAPVSLTLRNVRTFADLDVTFVDGITVLRGPGGAGKSTILGAIDTALFCAKGELAGLLTTGEDELLIELVFSCGGETYRVRRTYRGGKSYCDFERRVDG